MVPVHFDFQLIFLDKNDRLSLFTVTRNMGQNKMVVWNDRNGIGAKTKWRSGIGVDYLEWNRSKKQNGGLE